MARDEHRHRVPRDRRRHRPVGPRRLDRTGELAVGRHPPLRDPEQRLPDLQLQVGAAQRHPDGAGAAPSERGVDRPPGRLAVDDQRRGRPLGTHQGHAGLVGRVVVEEAQHADAPARHPHHDGTQRRRVGSDPDREPLPVTADLARRHRVDGHGQVVEAAGGRQAGPVGDVEDRTPVPEQLTGGPGGEVGEEPLGAGTGQPCEQPLGVELRQVQVPRPRPPAAAARRRARRGSGSPPPPGRSRGRPPRPRPSGSGRGRTSVAVGVTGAPSSRGAPSVSGPARSDDPFLAPFTAPAPPRCGRGSPGARRSGPPRAAPPGPSTPRRSRRRRRVASPTRPSRGSRGSRRGGRR